MNSKTVYSPRRIWGIKADTIAEFVRVTVFSMVGNTAAVISPAKARTFGKALIQMADEIEGVQ